MNWPQPSFLTSSDNTFLFPHFTPSIVTLSCCLNVSKASQPLLVLAPVFRTLFSQLFTWLYPHHCGHNINIPPQRTRPDHCTEKKSVILHHSILFSLKHFQQSEITLFVCLFIYVFVFWSWDQTKALCMPSMHSVTELYSQPV